MWIFFAVGASMLWGITYVLGEQIYKKAAISTTLAFMCGVTAVFMLLFSFFRGELKKDIVLFTTDSYLFGLLLSVTAIFILAELLIGYSIVAKNATLAGLIEISYPIFIALFSYLIFKDNQITTGSIAGALLIFSGIFVVYHFNH